MQTILIRIHVFIGAAILLTGLLQLVLPKFHPRHKVIGRIYLWSMIISFVTSFPVSVTKGELFLALIGIFSLFLAFTGARFAHIRSRGTIEWIDRFGAIVFSAAAVAMIALVLYFLFRGAWTAALILGVFATIFALSAFRDLYYLVIKRDATRMLQGSRWLGNHIGRIIGSYIAAVTAFLVNVEPFGSTVINWLLPTLLGMVLMSRMIRRYVKRA